MKRRVLMPALFVSFFLAADTSAHNVRMSPSVSPYLLLTRSDLLRNRSLPVYQMYVRPHLAARSDGFSSFPHTPRGSTLSPYLHLTRKDVDPFFPAYQMAVQPALGRRGVFDRVSRPVGYSNVSAKGLRREIYVPQDGRFWPTTGTIRSGPVHDTRHAVPHALSWP